MREQKLATGFRFCHWRALGVLVGLGLGLWLGFAFPPSKDEASPRDLPKRSDLLVYGSFVGLEGRFTGTPTSPPSDDRSPDPLVTRGPTLRRHLFRFEQLSTSRLTAEQLGSWGLTELLAGRVESAVEHLMAAVEKDPSAAVYHSDLAVSFLARAAKLNQPLDWLRAFEQAEHALEIDPAGIEARYNRALALEKFGLIPLALRLWNDTLAQESDPEWAARVRARIAALASAAASPEPVATPEEQELIASLHHDLARHDYSAAHRKVRLARERGDSAGSDLIAARLAWAEGLASARTGFPHRAIMEFRIAGQHFAQLGSQTDQGYMLVLESENLSLLGQNQEAWAARARAARLLSPHGQLKRLFTLLADLGDRAQDEGLVRVAYAAADLAVDLLREAHSPTVCEALLWRARLALRHQQRNRAASDLALARQALTAVSDQNVASRYAADADSIAAAIAAEEDPGTALAAAERALAYYRRNDLRFDLAPLYATQARALTALGDEASVEQALRLAGQEFEAARVQGAPFDLAQTYFERAQPYFDTLMELAARQQRSPWEILALAEQARSLLASPRRRGTADDLRASASLLPPGSVVVLFALTPGHLFVWRLLEGQLDLHVAEIDTVGLRERVEGFARAIGLGQPRERWADAAQTLYRDLFEEAVGSLPEGQTLFVVPDRFLSALPFAALQNPASGRLLIEDFAIALAPSLTEVGAVLERARGREQVPEHVVLFGSSLPGQAQELKAAEAEVRELKALYPKAQVFEGSSATKRQFLSALAEVEVLHFAGHAWNDPEHPSLSHLLFSDAGDPATSEALYAHELDRVAMPHLRLVVLAACNSAGLSESRAGSIAGLARPFLGKGADAVVATLWDVRDDDALVFATAFHRNLQQGLSAPEALREAQLAFLHSPPGARRGAPWAAFQLIGYLP